MTLSDMEAAEAADDVLARQALAAIRRDAIFGAAEAQDHGLTAFALALRLDLSIQDVLLYLREAPPLRTADEVHAWVEAIPHPPSRATLQ